jgi:hypothetical protein
MLLQQRNAAGVAVAADLIMIDAIALFRASPTLPFLLLPLKRKLVTVQCWETDGKLE